MSLNLNRRHFLGASAAALSAAILIRPSAGLAAGFPVTHSDADWRRILGPQRFAILRQAATEPAFSSPLLNEHHRGQFVCAGCQQPLFSSATKFESGTGWPSFWQPLPNAVLTKNDSTLGMGRTEVLCRRCGGHLGHVFDDGPQPTGKRYCMNGVAMTFKPKA